MAYNNDDDENEDLWHWEGVGDRARIERENEQREILRALRAQQRRMLRQGQAVAGDDDYLDDIVREQERRRRNHQWRRGDRQEEDEYTELMRRQLRRLERDRERRRALEEEQERQERRAANRERQAELDGTRRAQRRIHCGGDYCGISDNEYRGRDVLYINFDRPERSRFFHASEYNPDSPFCSAYDYPKPRIFKKKWCGLRRKKLPFLVDTDLWRDNDWMDDGHGGLYSLPKRSSSRRRNWTVHNTNVVTLDRLALY